MAINFQTLESSRNESSVFSSPGAVSRHIWRVQRQHVTKNVVPDPAGVGSVVNAVPDTASMDFRSLT